MAYILSAGALSKLVVSTDSPNTDAHDLTHFYEEKSEDHVAIGLRWFYCGGLGIALGCMGTLLSPAVPSMYPILSGIEEVGSLPAYSHTFQLSN